MPVNQQILSEFEQMLRQKVFIDIPFILNSISIDGDLQKVFCTVYLINRLEMKIIFEIVNDDLKVFIERFCMNGYFNFFEIVTLFKKIEENINTDKILLYSKLKTLTVAN